MMEWISVIISLLIIGIFLDGIRRVRKARKEGIRFSSRARKVDDESDLRVGDSEFPSGGARVAVRRDQEEAESLNKDVRKSFASTRTTLGVRNKLPEQVSLNLEEAVPMLMDSVEGGSNESENAASPEDSSSELEPSLGTMQELDTLEEKKLEAIAQVQQAENVEEQAVDNEEELPEAEEVLIINIMAKSSQAFQGELLLETLVSEHMKFGEMDIFHRYEEISGDGGVLFSMANMVVPGTFNLAEMKNFSTPGVSLFMQLPLRGESLEAFDIMANTARALAGTLEGELKDENRSVMTQQTFEHYRQRVVEFERKRKLQNA